MGKYFAITSEDGSKSVYKEEDRIKSVFSFGKEEWVPFSKIEEISIPGDTIKEVSYDELEEILSSQRFLLDNLLELAVFVSKNAHEGQYDKGGKPYFSHPDAVAKALDDTEQKIIAYLHDVCEDTSLTLKDLASFGFTSHILYSLSLLTKEKHTPYMDYVKKIKTNRSSTEVKKSDLRHNMDLSRIPEPSEKDFVRLEKYKKALAFLEKY